jgi:hypothetical protein
MLKRITPDEILEYTPLISGDPLLLQKAVAFTLTEDPTDPRWEIVTYYTDNSVPNYKLHPLEMMYGEWYSIDDIKDRGDERDL